MVAIKNHEAERFLARDVGSYVFFLVHGSDVGLVSERVRRIVKGLVDDPQDPFQLVRLSGEELGGAAPSWSTGPRSSGSSPRSNSP